MTRRKKLLLGGAAMAMLGAAAAAWWLLGGTAKVEHCGVASWNNDPDFTIVERHAGKLVIRRVRPDGELTELGAHQRDDAKHAGVVPGVGTFYAIYPRGWEPPRECRVYDAGKELYNVPLHLLYMGRRALAPVAVLPEGRLLTTYRDVGRPTSPADPEELLIERVAILTLEGKKVVAHSVAPDPKAFAGLAVAGMAVSGDGTTVAVSLRPMGAQQGPFRTLVCSAKDLKPLSTIEGFSAQSMSHDGSLMIGKKGDSLAVYSGGQLVAERPDCKSYYVRASWDGAFAFMARGPLLTEVLETKSLTTVFQVRSEPGYDQAMFAVSCTGRLAVVEYAWPRKDVVRARLRVYGKDGSVAFSRDFGTTRTCRVSALHWTRDGKVLYYLLGEEGRVVRCPVP